MRKAWLVLPLALVVTCGGHVADSPTATDGPLSARAPASHRLLWFSGADGVVGFDTQTGVPRTQLGHGIAASDWSVFYQVLQRGGATAVTALSPRSGATVATIKVVPGYDLPNTSGATPAGVSANGQWLVLTAPQERVGAAVTSKFAVIELAKRSVTYISVSGDMTFDAIDDYGRSLYLVEHLTAPSPTSYRVRVADVSSATLLAGPIIDFKQAATTADASGLMSGIYHASVPGPSGEWHFGMYFNPKKGAFIHALNTRTRLAQCILDLPNGADPSDTTWRSNWTLAAGRRNALAVLYAVNAAKGFVARIDPYEIKVKGSSTFAPLRAATDQGLVPANGAVTSPDGALVYAVGPLGYIAINTSDLSLRGTYLTDRAIRSLALDLDGSRLYALSADGGTIWNIEAGTGRAVASHAVQGAGSLLRVAN